MSGERAEQLPEELGEWVEERAESAEIDESDVLARSIAVYRFLEEESESFPVGDGQSDRPLVISEDVLERLDTLDDRVDEVEDDIEGKVEDVRDRVIQVKREADEKAPTDHEHEELRDRAEEARQTATEALDTVEDLESRVDQGFENYEEVLEYLTETTDGLEGKVDTLARVIIDLRDRVREVEGSVSVLEAVGDLQAEANREGITTALCANCGSKVQVGLLASPSCPHCDATFQGVDPASGFFSSATLTTGELPQLEDGEPQTPESPEELFDDRDEETE